MVKLSAAFGSLHQNPTIAEQANNPDINGGKKGLNDIRRAAFVAAKSLRNLGEMYDPSMKFGKIQKTYNLHNGKPIVTRDLQRAMKKFDKI